jgi:DNA-binding SARP family transcriptional activator/WD40 repeat protein
MDRNEQPRGVLSETASERKLIELRVLGVIEVVRRGRPIALGGTQQRRLLALLSTSRNAPVSIGYITEALWHNVEPPSAPERTIQSYVSRLRGALGDGLINREANGYSLNLDQTELDSDRFINFVANARGRPPAVALASLQEALAIWGGVPFGEFCDEPWAISSVTRLSDLHRQAREDEFTARLALGAHREVIGELEAAVHEHPGSTQFVGQLMIAQYRSGGQANALRAFQSHRRHLSEESGLDPAPALVELERRIVSNAGYVGLSETAPTIRGYELLEPLGTGPIGTTYRARQPVTNREVAVKVINTEYASDPEFMHGFDIHAQRLARLEHPHIVAFYDFWREPGSAFLVSRVLSGGNLGELRQDGLAWTIDRTSRLVNQLGGAVAATHQVGLVHGNIRDSNVLFDDLGNAYLADFPVIANRRSDTATPQTDSADFARLIWSVLVGRAARVHEQGHLFAVLRGERPDVPQSVAELVTRFMDQSEGNFPYPAADFLARWNQTCGSGQSAADTPKWSGDNPYKGLRPFDETDAEDFFGREALVDDLDKHLESLPFLALVGPSGSGKSSAVRAGLLPRWRARGWTVVLLRPDVHPMDSFHSALSLAGIDSELLPRQKVVIVVDQLEEIYTLCSDSEERNAFLGFLCSVVTSGEGPRIITTLRADFLTRSLDDPLLSVMMRHNCQFVSAMSARDLERCVRGPAQRRGIELESRLVVQIVADVNSRPGSLPLLQFALAELFNHRSHGALSLASYDEVGGLGGALARRAEKLFESLTSVQSDQLPNLFSRLVTSSEEQPESGRRVALRELPVDTHALVYAFVDSRLLFIEHEPVNREPVVALAHEAILSHWPRARGWLEKSLDDARIFRQIHVAARTWELSGRSEADLYRGTRLQNASAAMAQQPRSLTPSEARFLEESNRYERRATDRQRRSLRQVRALSGGLAILLAVAVFGAAVAANQRHSARQAEYQSETSRLLASSVSLATEDRAVSLLLGVEGSRRSSAGLDAEKALLRVLTATPDWLGDAWMPFPLRHLMLSRDRTRVLGIGDSGVVVVDVISHRVLKQRKLQRSRFASPSLLLGPKSTVIVSDGDFDLRLLDDKTLADVGKPISPSSSANSTAVSPDGKLLAIGGDFTSVQLWDVESHSLIGEMSTDQWSTNGLSTDGLPVALAFSRDGKSLGIAERSAVSVWDIGRRLSLHRFSFGRVVDSLVLAGNDNAVIVSSGANEGVATVAALDPQSGAERWRVDTPSSVAAAIAVDGVGHVLISDPSGIRRVEVLTGNAERETTHPVRSFAGSSKDNLLVAAGETQTLTFWSVRKGGALSQPLPEAPASCALQQSEDGKLVACGQPLRVWDLSKTNARILLRDDRGKRGFLLTGARILIVDNIGGWEIIDARRGTVVERGKSERLVGGGVSGLGPRAVASPDGRWLATVDATHVWLIDFRRNTTTVLLEVGSIPEQNLTQPIRLTAFTDDGRLLLVEFNQGDLLSWDTKRWAGPVEVWSAGRVYETSQSGRVASFLSTFRSVATGEMVTRIVDRHSGSVRTQPFGGLPGEGAAAMNVDRTLMAIGEIDGTVRLWDVGTRRPIGVVTRGDSNTEPQFSLDDSHRLITAQTNQITLWNLDPTSWLEVACQSAGRNLSRNEWTQYGPRGTAYRATCSQWPPG